MSKKAYFAIGLHNHQPVGNFDFVMERAYNLCYKPLIDFFINNPDFIFSMHFSGYLFLWLEKNHPEYISSLKTLANRGQIEFLSGGFYEPILSIIPNEDKILQINKMNKYIWNKFGQKPRGLWMAERVWEPHLVKYLSMAEIEYIVLDDAHFLSTGLFPENLFGYYIMEEQGYTLKVFPINMKLRYLIPFHYPDEIINYIKNATSTSEDKLAIYFDDGEKFGLWPDTYKTVYEDRWLDNFWQALKENSKEIGLVHYGDYINKFPPLGRIYLPTASYREMMEWVLFPEAQKVLEELTNEVKEQGKWDKYSPFIRGGFFRNFLSKYDESNHMHKRMLYVRNKIKNIEDNEKRELAIEEILMAQANDAYWHGIFGGLYLPHLRSAIYSHIIKAESFIDSDEISIKNIDFDCDGREEIILESKYFNLYFAPNLGGGVLEWDYKPASFNLTDTLTRRKEAYHDKLFHIKDEEGKGKTIHERWAVKEEGLENLLFYDSHRRISFKEYFFDTVPSIISFWHGKEKPLFTSLDVPFTWNIDKNKDYAVLTFSGEKDGIKLVKSFIVDNNKKDLEVFYSLENNASQSREFVFAWEIVLNFLAGEHEDYYFQVDGEKYLLRTVGEKEIDFWQIKTPILNLDCSLDRKTLWYRYPVETVSLSEEGFERVYQGSSLIHLYNVYLSPNEKFVVRVKFTVY
ncbi:MAG: 4-alpha-glucanotransferase [Dictyoglomus sp. NZ13-RE01]|nr:MAG: 4-alpha-glucanotransferase [Dictyoglomus sp. NZ13-RE01]